MPRTHEQVPLDVAVADQAAIVRAVIIDDHELARVEPRHGYRPRAVPIVEAMMALVLADHMLRQAARR
jgi:chorismate synthase